MGKILEYLPPHFPSTGSEVRSEKIFAFVYAVKKKFAVVRSSASIFLVSNTTKLVVSDIDGTITRQAFTRECGE